MHCSYCGKKMKRLIVEERFDRHTKEKKTQYSYTCSDNKWGWFSRHDFDIWEPDQSTWEGTNVTVLEDQANDLEGNLIYFEILESIGTLSFAAEKIDQLSLVYPRSAQLWIYRGILALESADIKRAEESFTIGYRLNASSYNAWILGSFYQSQGDLQKSLEFYQIALNQSIPVQKFSQNVAARFPLPGIYLDCFPEVKTYTGYINPGLEAAHGLTELDCQEAACLYQALLNQFPNNHEILNQLEELPCVMDFDESQCDFE